MEEILKRVEELDPLIPALEELRARPRRIVLHWTGGGPTANALERSRYHYLFEQPNGAVVVGVNSVDANMRVIDDKHYAAHTRGFNSYSVGMSFCGMKGATEGGSWGDHPLTEEQVRGGLFFVALACKKWGLDPREPAHLFTHYEAETLHGVDQVPDGPGTWKWDINTLPFLDLDKDDVGPWLRLETDKLLWEIKKALHPTNTKSIIYQPQQEVKPLPSPFDLFGIWRKAFGPDWEQDPRLTLW